MNILMTYSLVDLAIVVLQLWIFKVFKIIAITKIKFFNFSSTKIVKLNVRKLKTIRNLQQKSFFLVFHWKFLTNLPSNNNISITLRVNIAFAMVFKEYLRCFLMICRLTEFKVYESLVIHV